MFHNYEYQEDEKVKEWLKKALRCLLANDRDILIPNAIETDFVIEGERRLDRKVHETTINHRFAFYLESLCGEFQVEGYKFDLEYNRFGNNKKFVDVADANEPEVVRPDILVHKRMRMDEEIPHFLVIEAKKEKLIPKDYQHVKGLMRDEKYKYKYGCLISYYESVTHVNVTLITFDNGQFNDQVFQVEK